MISVCNRIWLVAGVATFNMSITYFAKTDINRGQPKTFGINQPDRRLHTHIIGKTGVGKSTLLKNLITQDIQNGHGVAVIDPHGDLVEDVLNHIPTHRTGDVVYFNPADQDFPTGFNVLEQVEQSKRPLIASHVVSIFKNIYKDSWGARLEYILYNSILSLLNYENSTLLSIQRLLTDKTFRSQVIAKNSDPVIKNFWLKEYDVYNTDFKQEAISPIQNKVGQFLTSSPIRNIVGQVKSKIDMGFMMDNRRILLCNFSKGEIGEDKSQLLGSLVVTKIFLSALNRASRPEHTRKDFYLYIDETQNVATPILSSILSESRKYRLNLITTNQYLDQIPVDIKKSIIGNVGTLITFRLGSHDAIELESEFAPEFNTVNLENLNRYQIYLKLAINGITSKPFSAVTLPPTPISKTNRENIIKTSRQRYAIKRNVIEDKIHRWFSK